MFKRDEGLRAMVARVWKTQVKMGIAIPKESLPETLKKKLRQELRKRKRSSGSSTR